MRISALAILTTVAILTTAPAVAQRYDANYPICLQSYGLGGGYNIDCSYTSMEQCQATASGLSATCDANPYYANAQAPRRPTSRQPRRGY
jgi:Tfp pilus assembly protein PilV